MNKKIITLIGLFSLLTLTALAASGLCQEAGKQPAATAKGSEVPQVTLKGKFVHNEKSAPIYVLPTGKTLQHIFQYE